MAPKIAANIEMVESTAELFKSFSDPHRLGIMILLIDHEQSVGELANALSSSISSVSHQLKQLRLARLVSKRRDGRSIFYTLHDDHIRQLIIIAQEHINEQVS